MLAAEPTESTDAKEPADPIDRIDPAEPMERIDPLDPMLKMEPLDPMLKMEPSVFRIRSFSRGLSRGVHGAGGSQRTADTWPTAPAYDMNAAFMSFQPHESGIHAVRPGAREAGVTEVRFRARAMDDGEWAGHEGGQRR